MSEPRRALCFCGYRFGDTHHHAPGGCLSKAIVGLEDPITDDPADDTNDDTAREVRDA